MRHLSLKQIREGGDQKPEILAEFRGQDRGLADAGITPIKGRDRAFWWIIASGLGLTAAIAFGTAILISSLQDRARADAKRVLNTTAYVISEHLEAIFQSLELVQKNVIERMQPFGIASSEDLDRLMSGIDTHLMLKDMISGVPQLDTLILVDAAGKLVGSSRAWPVKDATENDREYFAALTSDSNLTLFLNQPARSRRTGAWTSYLARRLVGPNGKFIGMIVGGWAAVLRAILRLDSIGNEVAIAFQADGLLRARSHRAKRHLPRPLCSRTPVDAVARSVVSLKALTHYPVVVWSRPRRRPAPPRAKQAKIIVGAVLARPVDRHLHFLHLLKLMQELVIEKAPACETAARSAQAHSQGLLMRFAGSRGSLQQALWKSMKCRQTWYAAARRFGRAPLRDRSHCRDCRAAYGRGRA